MTKYYELTIIPKDITQAREIVSSLAIAPEKEQRGTKFFSLEFFAEPKKIEEIEKNLKSNPQILRYLILVKTPQKIQAEPELKKPSREGGKKVELEEIEKKLDEILKS